MNFTPQQQHSLLSKMGYDGPVNPKMMEAFLSSNPGAAAKMGKFSRAMQKGFAEGGSVVDPITQAFQETFGRNPQQEALDYYNNQLQQGKSITDIKNTLQNSPEAVIRSAYQSQLGRQPQDEALQYWMSNYNPETFTSDFKKASADELAQQVKNQYSTLDPSEVAKLQSQDLTQARKTLDEKLKILAQVRSTGNEAAIEKAQQEVQQAQDVYKFSQARQATTAKSTGELSAAALNDPMSLVTKGEVEKIGVTPEQLISGDTGVPTSEIQETDVSTVDTAQTVTAPDKTTASTMDATTSGEAVGEALEGVAPAQGEVSTQVQAQATDPTTLAQLGLSAPQIEIAQQIEEVPDLQLTPEQLAQAATLASTGLELPQAVAQVTGESFQAVAAKFDGTTPQAEAVTDYDLGTVQTGTREVSDAEIPQAQGIGMTAEQAETITSDYESNIEAAKGKVGDGELTEPQDYYNLPPTDTAKISTAKVEEAAKVDKYPTTEAAQSDYQSIVESAQGRVGSNELVNPKDVLKAAEAVEAVAKTMGELDSAAIAVAQQGTLSQASIAKVQLGSVPPEATVRGQMAELMSQFDDGTPVWAAGAMRAANAAMAARGLGGSSMAGAAIVQAAMESAIPIAQQDAQAIFNMNLTNVNNRQQVALANAAASQNMDLANLNNRQQAALQNSNNAFALQSQNLSNQQAVVIANAQMKASLQETSLGITAQVALANAAKYAEMNKINLNNKQQSLMQASAQNLQVNLANLDNKQQTAIANLQVQASLRGQELSNEQQMAVLQSTQNFESAQFDATAKQQAFLQDAQSRAALEGRSMEIRSQTAMFNASRIAEVNNINLNNEQQAILQQSAENLQIEIQDLSNRQQTALANAQLRATLQGKVLDNKQQAAIIESERFAEANNLTFNAKQQAVIQEYVSNAALQGKVLDNKQQTAIFNVANVLQERQLELTNEQQTRLFNTTNEMNIELANLSNKQQTALANAQIDAAITGQELSNTQQTNVVNAARISEIANINFTADQQKALENAKLAQTVDLANLDASSAKLLADAAAMSNMDMANLNNRQQAQVENARNMLQMDLTNVNNQQQTAIFKSQQMINSILSDQAAENSAKQFNAASENQVNQFYDNLVFEANRFSAQQTNAINQFNAGEENANEKFMATLREQRDQFIANNNLIVAQANAKWRQDVSTMDTAAQNEANMEAARTANLLTTSQLDKIYQRERDLMDMAFRGSESEKDRDVNILLADKNLQAYRDKIEAEGDMAFGAFVADTVSKIFF